MRIKYLAIREVAMEALARSRLAPGFDTFSSRL